MLIARRSRLLCLSCQWRTFSTTHSQLAEKAENKAGTAGVAAIEPKAKATTTTTAKPTTPTPTPPPSAKDVPPSPPPLPSPLANAPKSYGKRLEAFTPTPLSRPIGLPYPPEAGQNTGIDSRTLKQRRDDFVNYEKHIKKREQLKSQMARPYFRDWTNLQFHKGKTFIAPPRLFRGDLSLYFPNLYGQTLLKSDRGKRDTTPTLRGRVSVVSMFSSLWGENQAKSFASAESNPELEALLAEHQNPPQQNQDQNKQNQGDQGGAGVVQGQGQGGLLQHVWINIEEDWMKAWIIRLFGTGNLRRRLGEPNWHRYFLVRQGISDEIRESIGYLNSKVGYTYLLDSECRIRWAGSGQSEADEREGLVKAVQRLLEEEKAKRAAVQSKEMDR